MIRTLTIMLGWLCLLIALPAHAEPQFPALSGRVVDAANIISPATEAALTQKLAALETQSQRQLVVATVPNLDGYDVADYGYQLGRHWGIGAKERNDGVLLLIAPNERRMNISVGYGLEPILTDALSGRIIRDQITPKFKAGDYDGGITAGVDAIAQQITLPPEEARAIADQATRDAQAPEVQISLGAIIFFLFFFFFFVLPLLRAIFGSGKRHRGRHSGIGPIVVWGDDDHWGGGSGGGGWGGGGFGGGGGFSGGGGSFGGGGASGGW